MWLCRSGRMSALPLSVARRAWPGSAPSQSFTGAGQRRPIWVAPWLCSKESSAPSQADPPHIQQRQFSKVTDSRLIEHYLEDVFGEEDPMEHMRNIMHLESSDPVVLGLSQASSVSQIFNFLEGIDISLPQAEQAIASLFHLQKFTSEKVNYLPSPKFGSQVLGHPTFKRILEVIERDMCQQPLSHGAYTFLALLRLEVPLGQDLIVRLQIHLQRRISAMDLDALTYLCVALRGRNSLETRVREASLSWHLALAPAIPYLGKFIESAQNAEDIRKIAICVNALSRLVSDDFMNRFCSQVSNLLAQGEFATDESLSALVKVLSISLAKRDWHLSNYHFVRELILQLTGRVHALNPVQLLVVNKLVSKNKDPVSIHYELADVLTKMYQDLQANPGTDFVFEMEVVRALSTSGVFIWPPQQLNEIIANALDHPQSHMVMNCVFDILRSAGLSHESLNKAVLVRALEACRHDPLDFHRLIVRYNDLANNMAQKIRDIEFERKTMDLIRETIMTCPFPGRFSSHFSFLISYGGEISDALLQRFLDMVPNMNAFCVLLISRSLETRNKQSNTNVYGNFHAVQLALTKQAQKLLAVEQTSPEKFMLLKSQYCRQRASDSGYESNLQGPFNLVSPTDLEFNTVTMRRICQSLKNLYFTMDVERPDDFIETSVKYVINHGEHLHSYVTNVVLSFFFNINYDRPLPKEFFEVCSHALIRDMKYDSTITVLQGAIALAFFNQMSPFVIDKLFNFEFMDRLDQELKLCAESGVQSYPSRIRRSVLLLNRTVILHTPEYKVPWLEDDLTPVVIASRDWVMTHTAGLRQEVQIVLTEILGGREYFQEHLFTPFYSFLDFEVVINQKGKPVKKDVGNFSQALRVLNRSEIDQERDRKNGLTRYAILVMAPQAYAFNKEVLKGFLALTVRNIEKEGFKVICINPFHWQGMHMANKTGKAQFLRQQLGVKR